MSVNKTWRERRIVLSAGKVTIFQPSDTKPNFFVLTNLGNYNVSLATFPGVATSVYEKLVPPKAVKRFGKAVPVPIIYLIAAGDTEIIVASMETEFSPDLINESVESENNMVITHAKYDVPTGVSTMILSETTNRKYLLIANISDVDMFINLGGTAVLNEGIPVMAKGQFEMFMPFTSRAAINCIHAGGVNKRVLVTEGVG